MKRPAIIPAMVAIAIFAVLATWRLTSRDADVKTSPWKTTDVWYHASDVALLATSGRPQLVEFFHPD